MRGYGRLYIVYYSKSVSRRVFEGEMAKTGSSKREAENGKEAKRGEEAQE
jgi:hypothetical protein